MGACYTAPPDVTNATLNKSLISPTSNQDELSLKSYTRDLSITPSQQQTDSNYLVWICPKCLHRTEQLSSCNNCNQHQPPQQYDTEYITHDIHINNLSITARSSRFNEKYIKINSNREQKTFGTVYKCYKRGDIKKTMYAVKQMKKTYIYSIEGMAANLKNEIEIMITMKHENILSLYDVFETDNYLYLIMESLSGRPLIDKIEETDGMKEKDAAIITKQILNALSYIHSKHIAHFALNTNDIMFEGEGDDLKIKIINFSNARILKESQKLHEKKIGSLYYMAPEQIEGEYDHAVDLWSVGVIVFEMLYSFLPFYIDDTFNKNREHKIYGLIQWGFKPIIRDGFGPWFPKTIPISNEAMDFIKYTLKTDVSERLNVSECLSHRFIQRINGS